MGSLPISLSACPDNFDASAASPAPTAIMALTEGIKSLLAPPGAEEP